MSVSLPGEDIEFLDTHVKDQSAASRSAALHKAVGLLRAARLADACEDARASRAASGDPGAREPALAGGLDS